MLRVSGYTPPAVTAQLGDQSAALSAARAALQEQSASLAAALEATRAAAARAEAAQARADQATAAATLAQTQAATAAQQAAAAQQQATTAQTAATTAQTTASSASAGVALVRTLIGTGSAQSAATLLAGAVTTLRIPIAPAMPTTGYSVATSLVTSTPTLLGRVVVDAVTSRELDAVTVQLRNTGLAVLGLTGTTVTAITFATLSL